jgi:uncharacterized protein DUF6714
MQCIEPAGKLYPSKGATLSSNLGSFMTDALNHYRDAVVSSARLGPKVALDPRGAELVVRIERAFANWPPNDGLTWVQAEMLDNHEPEDVLREGAHIGAYDRWQDVPPELLAAFPSAAGFIDDAGANFYWPALMTWELLYGPTYETGFATPAERVEEWSERLRPQTEEQSQVFIEYKQYISDRYRKRLAHTQQTLDWTGRRNDPCDS